MGHLPSIVTDLAIILLVAGFTTLLFKKMKQPLVLGYIVAGFLTGPNFHYFPTVTEMKNVSTWAEIGVIFLMFGLGLEFSFYKLKKVGSTAVIATSIAVGGMILLGNMAGQLLGWSDMNSLFVGCMLCMSSTAIIIKAFDDLGLKDKPFANTVFGVLILEDIVGIVLLVVLSTIATATSGISHGALFSSVLKLGLTLIIWFVSGMYLIPTFFKKARDLMTGETMLISSLGLCLGMVYLADYSGYSAALGAFIMGSFIAEAPDAETIEHRVAPIKELFAAVFFVSVGMMVDPKLLLTYWVPVLVLVVVTIAGQISCSFIGMLLAGQRLENAVKSAFSLCQIGEFSFIIASLGTNAGVTESFLYPIIVAVSVITTFTTPFCIKLAEPCLAFLQNRLPKSILKRLERFSAENTDKKDEGIWRELLMNYAQKMIIHYVILAAIYTVALFWVLPVLTKIGVPYPRVITAAVALFFMAPIIVAVLRLSTTQRRLGTILWFNSWANHLPLFTLHFLKILVSFGALYSAIFDILDWNVFPALLLSALMVYVIYKSDWLMGNYLEIENRFLVNLNEKHVNYHHDRKLGVSENVFLENDIFLAQYKLLKGSKRANLSLKQLAINAQLGCTVLEIEDNGTKLLFPTGSAQIPEEGSFWLMGSIDELNSFNRVAANEISVQHHPISLKDFMLADKKDAKTADFKCVAIRVEKESFFYNQSLNTLRLRETCFCTLIGIERGPQIYTTVDPNLRFDEGDYIWLLGKQKMLTALIRRGII